MTRSVSLIVALLALQCWPAAAATYYLDPAGSDAARGTTPATAWATLARLGRTPLQPGDRVLLASGARFAGPLRLRARDGGDAARPVVITASGTARATIVSAADGIDARDTAGIVIANLRVLAAADQAPGASGVHFHATRAGIGGFDTVILRQVEVAGFGQAGVLFEADDFYGFRNVTLDRVSAHDNGDVGIAFAGRYVTADEGARPYSFNRVHVTHSAAYRNRGDPASASNTGSGILLGQVDGGTVDYCTAHDNGGRGVNEAGGPVGIWTYDSNAITIEHNESWNNRTGNGNDGGGFDLDGGVSNSVIQYNYSHGNDGAGYLLTQFATARPFRHNRIRWNVSENDGRKNGYAAALSFADAGTVIEDTVYANNSFYVGDARTTPAGIRFFDGAGTYAGTAFRNNLILVDGPPPLIDVPVTDGIAFTGNLYFNYAAPPRYVWAGKPYSSLAAWRAATGQERVGGADTGREADPLLAAPGRGGTIGDPRRFDRLTAYTPRAGSPVIGAGLDLKRLFGDDVGATDFLGRPVRGDALPIGAVAGPAR